MKNKILHHLLEIYGHLDRFVVLKEDEQGRYIEYAFKEGAPKDNRCLSWYDKPHPKALIRNGYTSQWKLHEIGKIYELGLFSCGNENKEGDEHCSAGHPKKNCDYINVRKEWSYDEPVKCACWYLTSTNIQTIDDIPFFGGKTIAEVDELLSKYEDKERTD